MKKINIIGIALVVMFAFSTIGLPSASALEASWLINSQDIPTGQSWNASQTPAAGTLFLLEDMNEGVDVLCEGSGLAWLLPEGKDLQTTVTCAKAVTDAGTCEKPVSIFIGLNWETQLELIEPSKTWLDRITKSTTSGATPGWLIECTIPLIGRVNDECTTDTLAMIITNNEAGGIIEEELPEAIEPVNCTIGGNDAGLVTGRLVTEALTPIGVKIPLAVS